jgi:hypothetical protein
MAQREDDSLIEEMRETIRAERERSATRHGKALDPPLAPASAPPPAPPAEKGLLRRLLGRGQ